MGPKRTTATRDTIVEKVYGSAAIVILLVGTLCAQPPRDLAAALNHPSPSVRREALAEIDRSGARAATEAVAALARDPDDGVQLEAIETLLNLLLPQRIAERRKVALVIEVRRSGGAQSAFEAGVRPAHVVPSGVFQWLAEALGDLNPSVRLNAAYATAVLAADPSRVPSAVKGVLGDRLVVMLSGSDAALRIAAARAAGRAFRTRLAAESTGLSGGPQSLSDTLIGLMNRPTVEEQTAAMEALGLMRDVRGLQALIDRFAYHREEGPRVLALTALEALARIAHSASADLVKALGTDRWASRDGDTALTVAFARERILRDGSVAILRDAAGRPGLGTRAEGYLRELGAAP